MTSLKLIIAALIAPALIVVATVATTIIGSTLHRRRIASSDRNGP
jgi:hypothetical protein